MRNPLVWKLGLIAAVLVLAAVSVYPPEEKINLGLDLRGGAHIVMRVETASALEHETNLAQSRLGQLLKDQGIRYASIVPVDVGTLAVRGTDPGRRADVRGALDSVTGGWDIQELGPGDWRATMPPQLRNFIESRAVGSTLTVLRERIDEFGVREPLIQGQGFDRILVQLPGVEDPERVKKAIQDPALLEWKEVTYPPGVSNFEGYRGALSPEALAAQFGGALPDDTQIFSQTGVGFDGTPFALYWPLKRVSVVLGNDLKDARRSDDQWGAPQISFELTQEAGKRFEAATRENRGRIMAIILGRVGEQKVVSAPVIEDVIRDQGVIRGNFTIEEAEDLALKLRSGAIPTHVTIIEERVVGPSMGRDSIQAGLVSGLVGFVAVLLFMLIYYRLSGVNAVVALTMNILLVFGALGALPVLFPGVQATLTLPGIAGLILTVGMAVDSNVLIFERIREELGAGKTVRSAVEQGFQRAFITILDCNITTLIAAFFLFSYGTGPVQGFAVTLSVGLLASMFTAVFVSRQLFEIVLSRRARVETLSI